MALPVVEPVRRSFAILEALSRRPRGTISELAAESGLPRPTVVRPLQTLIELGYVLRISRQLGYRLTDRVLGLAQGIRFIDHLVDAAAPHMRRFARQHGWPLTSARSATAASPSAIPRRRRVRCRSSGSPCNGAVRS